MSPDIDGDGIDNACELCPIGSDSDADLICSTVDNCPFDSNPGQADTDADGIGDVCDNCAESSNPGQDDVDLDGFGDACEVGLAVSDVDLSGRVDGFDLARLARAFGTSLGSPAYDPGADLDRDEDVDGDDLAILASGFGQMP